MQYVQKEGVRNKSYRRHCPTINGGPGGEEKRKGRKQETKEQQEGPGITKHEPCLPLGSTCAGGPGRQGVLQNERWIRERRVDARGKSDHPPVHRNQTNPDIARRCNRQLQMHGQHGQPTARTRQGIANEDLQTKCRSRWRIATARKAWWGLLDLS